MPEVQAAFLVIEMAELAANAMMFTDLGSLRSFLIKGARAPPVG